MSDLVRNENGYTVMVDPFLFSKNKSTLYVLFVLAVFCAGVWSLILGPSALNQTAQANSRVAEVLAALPQDAQLDAATKTGGCAVVGPLPDHACTPGAVFADATPAVICVSGYTKKVRSVSTALKKRLYGVYGIAYPQPTGSYEMDHLIPLELGGSNDPTNLFPEAAQPNPGFKEKDVVENYLHQEVCAGRIGLRDAQVQIADDWVAVYNALSPDDIAKIKAQFRSWAN